MNAGRPLVCHLSPTHFGRAGGVVGGGERFAEELARFMARRVEVRLVCFGSDARRERISPGFERIILKDRSPFTGVPVSTKLFRTLRGADVIHCHQYYVLTTFLAALYGKLRGIPVFVSDLGGGSWTPAFHIDQSRLITAHLPISRYAAALVEGANRCSSIIYGGADVERFLPRTGAEHDGSVVFLGRILEHKGIHLLIDGAPDDVDVQVIGTVSDASYLERLRRLAEGKRVRFLHGLDDAAVIGRLQKAMVLVHPTPVDDDGSPGVNELFGLALVEAMACGCPVVASAVGPLPEIVEDGVNGLLVPPNDPGAIGRAIETLRADPALWQRLSRGALETATGRFTWPRVVDRCLAAYGLASAADSPPPPSSPSSPPQPLPSPSPRSDRPSR